MMLKNLLHSLIMNIKLIRLILQELIKGSKSLKNNVKLQKTVEFKYEKSRDEILDLKSRSLRENLNFYGMKHQSDQENCENLVKEIINTHLDFDPTNMVFERAHRLGFRASRHAQSIVVKFKIYTDREWVQQKSTDSSVQSALKDLNLGKGFQTLQGYKNA